MEISNNLQLPNEILDKKFSNHCTIRKNPSMKIFNTDLKNALHNHVKPQKIHEMPKKSPRTLQSIEPIHHPLILLIITENYQDRHFLDASGSSSTDQWTPCGSKTSIRSLMTTRSCVWPLEKSSL